MGHRTVGIVGLGLIGASFAKAYYEFSKDVENDIDIKVLAYDKNASVLMMAQMQGFVQDTLTKDNLADCDLVLISLYPKAAVAYLEENAGFFRKGGLVMDTCGTKRYVCEQGFRLANANGFTFVGGHPMAGTKFSGMSHSRASMFNGAPMIIVPERFDDMELVDKVREILLPAQFGSFCLTHPQEHDRMIAFTSQMAHLVSNAYVKSPRATTHKGFSAGSYKDMTRVAWLNSKMWAELFLENSDNLIDEIDTITEELLKYKKALVENNEAELVSLLEEGKKRKEEIDG